MGRKALAEQVTVKTFKLPVELKQLLEQAAEVHGKSEGEILREALNYWLKTYQPFKGYFNGESHA